MVPVGRLFFEIGGDTSRLNASLQEASTVLFVAKIASDAVESICLDSGTRSALTDLSATHFDVLCGVLPVRAGAEFRK